MLLYYSLAAFLPLLTQTTAQSSVPPAAAAPSGAASAAPAPGTLPAGASIPSELQGTWSTKSRSTLTGPGFYDPIADNLIEPDHTGISYSFTSDGHWEEAYYRAIANPVNPSCPMGYMQWQHGSWYMAADGRLHLTPIPDDGRQLTSNPCDGDNSIYIRYNQTEIFKVSNGSERR